MTKEETIAFLFRDMTLAYIKALEEVAHDTHHPCLRDDLGDFADDHEAISKLMVKWYTIMTTTMMND